MMKNNDKENKKMLLVNKINMALGILFLIIALFGLFRKPFYLETTITSFMLGSYILLNAYLNRKRITSELEGKIIADERSRRAFERAGFIAFFLLTASLMISGLANSFFNLGLEYSLTVNVILFAGVFSWIIIGYYLDKKGDV
jgi:uncharacterized membrane protein